VARFASVIKNIRSEIDEDHRHSVLLVSSGDNFLAGPEFHASLVKGPPFYDTIALDLIGYDAMAFGNHEFDFGPDVLAEFIAGFTAPQAVPFLSANLDFSEESELQELVNKKRIAKSVIIVERGARIGIIGATTPALKYISSPRNVIVDEDVVGAIQAEAKRLENMRVNKIILISHLQSVEEDLALIPLLDGIDIVVAGGGDEGLANPGDLLIPGDEGEIYGPYPLTATDIDGDTVYVVTTKGDYRYVGRLEVGFNWSGEIVEVFLLESGPVRVVGGDYPDTVDPDPEIQRLVVDPVEEALEAMATNVIGTSEVDLDGLRTDVRTMETNEGDLCADSLLWAATENALEFGVDEPDIALQNGGGIRNNNIIPIGPITELDTFSMLPFPNFVTIVEDVDPMTFKALLENAVSKIEFVSGRFAQVAGFTFVFDSLLPAGNRVIEATLDDGTVMISGGAVAPTARNVNVATIDFLARGGDEYDFGGRDFTVLGITYQLALSEYIQVPLGGLISATDYPVGGEGRIINLS
jgi:5'-nucleotidase